MMCNADKINLLREAMKRIRELTYEHHDPKRHRLDWARIQAEAAKALRNTE